MVKDLNGIGPMDGDRLDRARKVERGRPLDRQPEIGGDIASAASAASSPRLSIGSAPGGIRTPTAPEAAPSRTSSNALLALG